MSTIAIHSRDIKGIPTLEVIPKEMEGEPLACVLYFHGFTSAKEHNLPFAYMLAERGYRVLLPDSQHHGERYVEMSEKDLQLSFWNIVHQNIQDGNVLYAYLQEHHLLLENRLGVAGTSMGGITASSMLATYDWIKAIAVFMGTAKTTSYANKQLRYLQEEGIVLPEQEIDEILETIAATDLSKHLLKMKKKPVFMWHGEKDPVIPFTLAQEFYESVKQEDIQITFQQDANAGHKVSREAFLAGANWVQEHL